MPPREMCEQRCLTGENGYREGFFLLPEVLERHRRENRAIRGYFNRMTIRAGDLLSRVPYGVALFDREGCLLKLVGPSDALREMETRGIAMGTLWTEQTVGQNAIVAGLAGRTLASSVGPENRAAPLADCSLYFAPILFNNEEELLGGVAVITTVSTAEPEHLFTAYAMANDFNLHMHVSEMYFRLWRDSGQGVLCIDATNRGKLKTMYHSEEIFQILEIKPCDLFAQPAEELFDPLPRNPELWDILAQRRQVEKERITLSVRGHSVDCVLSTARQGEVNLGTESMMLILADVQHESALLSKKIGNNALLTFQDIIGQSPAITATIRVAKRIARSDSNVMLFGESGVGKEIFAQSIHNAGTRRECPFIAVNCGALPRDLIASELFGYDGGAFTGAKKQGNIGKFELANKGTIFLDEIGELPLDLQAVLLRVVEQKQFTRLGGNTPVVADVKIISATNADLPALIEQKLFREDLYYRLNTLNLSIPPLRERGDDLYLLLEHFIRSVSRRIGRSELVELTPLAKELLRTLPWNGNVRELQNLSERIVQLHPERTIDADQLKPYLDNFAACCHTAYAHNAPTPLKAAEGTGKRQRLTREVIQEAIDACGGNRSKAADYLGIARKTLYRNMERLGM